MEVFSKYARKGCLLASFPKHPPNSSIRVWFRLVSGLRGKERTEIEDQVLIISNQKGLGSDRSSYGRTFLQ